MAGARFNFEFIDQALHGAQAHDGRRSDGASMAARSTSGFPVPSRGQ
jgi:hypothetical protein